MVSFGKINPPPSAKKFRFGAGPATKSLGIVTIFSHVEENTTESNIAVILPIQVDVVDSDVPMLISHEYLSKMQGSIDFESCALEIPNIGKIKLSRAKAGHLMIQGERPTEELVDTLSLRGHAVYMTEIKLPARMLSEEVAKIHVRLGQCSENTLLATIRAA